MSQTSTIETGAIQAETATACKGEVSLQPGLLVALHTEVRGGVVNRRDILANAEAEAEAQGVAVGESAHVDAYKAVRVVEDAEEHARAIKARSAARGRIVSICIQSPFGLLCPQSRAAELLEAIDDAHKIKDEFNKTSVLSKLDVWVMRGQIVASDKDAVLAIAQEIRGLLDGMNAGIAARDVEAIREACRKARAIATMLDAKSGERVSAAVEAARRAAREIAKIVKDKGSAVDVVLESESKLSALEDARSAFLDLDEAASVAESSPAVDGLDLDLGAPEPEAALPEAAPDAVDLGDVDASRAVDEDAAGYLGGELAAAPPAGGDFDF